jgi:23S rRNA pseudouridine1911/1915/1917 synthase
MTKSSKFTNQGAEPVRLDSFLVQMLSQHRKISRSQVQVIINNGAVLIADKKIDKPGVTVKPGVEVTVTENIIELEAADHFGGYDIPLEILYEDEALLVVNKPHGLTSHPGAGNSSQTLVNALITHFEKNSAVVPELFQKQPRAGIVHRLDKDTSGVMVVGKTAEALFHLSKQFADRATKRSYIALVLSSPRRLRWFDKADEGIIDNSIGRHPKQRTKMAVVKEGGRNAVTTWRVKERMNYASIVQFELRTGRTHQIRVHAAHQGAPIIGDKTYGDFTSLPKLLLEAAKKFGRQALHAETLQFTHPLTDEVMQFSAPIPEDFRRLIYEFSVD